LPASPVVVEEQQQQSTDKHEHKEKQSKNTILKRLQKNFSLIINTKEGIGKDHYTIMFFSELISMLFLIIFPGVLTGISSDHIVKVWLFLSLFVCLFVRSFV
jgi:hypothetical protein